VSASSHTTSSIGRAAAARLERSADSNALTIDALVSPVGLFEHFQYAPGRAGRDALHVHGDVQVCLSLNFAGRYRSGRFAADVPAGAVSIVDAWEPHAAEDPVDRPFVARYHVLYVPKACWDTLAALYELEPRVGITVRRHEAAGRALRRLYSGVVEGDSRMAHDERLGAVMRVLLRRRRPSRPVPPDSRRLERAREFIRAHMAAGVSLAEAANEAGLSPQHFAASFRARYGVPPHRFQTVMRLDMARAHLAAGVPAADVAAQCGFSDQSHLIRHFKRYIGMVPGAYRSMPLAKEA
jgi:AraC-like DNA-binding protein